MVCTKIAPFIDDLKEQTKEWLYIIKIDVDENPSICELLKIESMPTFCFYHNNGELFEQFCGVDQNKITSIIEKMHAK